jgi:hypothetical protein
MTTNITSNKTKTNNKSIKKDPRYYRRPCSSNKEVIFRIIDLLNTSKLTPDSIDNLSYFKDDLIDYKREILMPENLQRINIYNYLNNNKLSQITTRVYFVGEIMHEDQYKKRMRLILGQVNYEDTNYTYCVIQKEHKMKLIPYYKVYITVKLTNLLFDCLTNNELVSIEAWFKARIITNGLFTIYKFFDNITDKYDITEDLIKKLYVLDNTDNSDNNIKILKNPNKNTTNVIFNNIIKDQENSNLINGNGNNNIINELIKNNIKEQENNNIIQALQVSGQVSGQVSPKLVSGQVSEYVSEYVSPKLVSEQQVSPKLVSEQQVSPKLLNVQALPFVAPVNVSPLTVNTYGYNSGYNSGYTSPVNIYGYTSGYTSGYESGYVSPVNIPLVYPLIYQSSRLFIPLNNQKVQSYNYVLQNSTPPGFN